MKKSFVAILSTACLLSITGCAGNQGATNTGNDQLQLNRVGYNQIGQIDNVNRNRNITVQSRAASNIERLDEVADAQVIMRNNDAYVAVRLSNTNNNNLNGNGDRNATMTRTGNNDNWNSYRNAVGNNSATNTGTTGNLRGMANENNNIGRNANQTPYGNNPGTVNPGLGNNTNFTRNVGTDNQNNQAINGNNYSKVSTRLEQRIADQVRAADNNVHEVFVSVNSDFYNQMTNFTNDLENGQNRDGIYDEFTDTIRGFFGR